MNTEIMYKLNEANNLLHDVANIVYDSGMDKDLYFRMVGVILDTETIIEDMKDDD